KRNRKYTEFDVSDGKIAAKILESSYHMTDFTVQDGTIRIYDFSQSVGEINREFARNGLLITRINDSEENLEDYFSKLIGGGGIA
ncbi:bacitracin ABC transporter ATP-binding protein BcrA, partial [Enterococcus sp. C36]